MNVSQQIDQAVRLHHAGRYETAADLYRQVLQAEPGHLGALSGLGMIEYQAGRLDAAIGLLEHVVAVAGEHSGYLMNLGAVHDRAGHARQAADCYRRAITSSPRYPDPYYNLGALYLRLGEPEAAVEVFDRCMIALGRDFHALAYKAHALRDAGDTDAAAWLLDHDHYVRLYTFGVPQGYSDVQTFNAALAKHVRRHPTLRANVMSTVGGKHTGELLRAPKGPMDVMEPIVDAAVRRYRGSLPDDPRHPVVRWAPPRWKLTSWGVVMKDGGHERSHIHPSGWISGVFYVNLPDVIADIGAAHQGWLRFGEPTAELPVRSAPLLRDYQPGYGRIILFPSYFYHGTVPFRSREERICVSFDVEPVYR